MSLRALSHLECLEAEAIHILRETAAQFERPMLLFSGGKDSITLAHLAEKAFRPAPAPFPYLHIDTGHNFPETLAFRDAFVARTEAKLVVRQVEESIRQGRAAEEKGKFPSRNRQQAVTLLDAIAELKLDACIGGGRRDEEKARAKERIFSVRDEFGGWEPRLQRPELWNLLNGRIHIGENVRVFPLSNWTELDVWQYIRAERIPLPELYFAHRRQCLVRDGLLFPMSPFVQSDPGDDVRERQIRFRTVGDMTCTAAVLSEVQDVDGIIDELRASDLTERGSRLDDQPLGSGHGRPQTRGVLLMELLRFITCGSVDDGKSTLIGRLLYDSKVLLREQVAALERSSARSTNGANGARSGPLNLALLTDGLRAEREQGITIDVAYKYFATPRRKFVVADTPGHVQYTRNMVTGASTADLAVLLVDARQGLLEQTRRHAYLASFLRIPRLVLAVNKMDAVAWSRDVFEEIRDAFAALTRGAGFAGVHAIPVSALEGDNVVEPSRHTPYYDGPPLLRFLEEIEVPRTTVAERGRLPVQLVLRPSDPALQDYRAYAGEVTSGVFRPGDAVLVLPSNLRTTIAAIERCGEPVDEAFAPMSVALRLSDDIDVGRGELIASAACPPQVSQELSARLCWMVDRPLCARARLLVRHTTAAVPGIVTAIDSVVDLQSFADRPAHAGLGLNEIGLVRIKTARPLAFDAYAEERLTGAFVLVDETTNGTVAAGMICNQAQAKGRET